MTERRPTLALDLVWKAGRQPHKSLEPELFALLDAIKSTGKLTHATERVGMPYRQAWGLITEWSERIGQPLVRKQQGRGTRLTLLGEKLLWLREHINARLSPHLESAACELERELSAFLQASNPVLTVFASHDLVMAELRELLRIRPGPKLDLRFVASLDGVVALCKNRCDLAGLHIPQGSLGREILNRYEPWLKPRAQRLIHLVRRTQGLFVSPGNPLGLKNLTDVVIAGARFINRQRGSGTHLALERLLQEQGIDRGEINGYYSEEFTHLGVAAAIASGVADVGLGIEAAARRLKLDFVPLFIENYYLLGKRETIDRVEVQDIVGILKSPEFAGLVSGIPGYDASRTGEVASVGDVIG